DFTKKENEGLVEKYEISFSSLLIATPSEFKNLTDKAFENAVNNPTSLRQDIISTIDDYLNTLMQ
ncbi:MAG: hypothetical protein ACRCSB_05750, partial [Bacteroidales bacterium]